MADRHTAAAQRLRVLVIGLLTPKNVAHRLAEVYLLLGSERLVEALAARRPQLVSPRNHARRFVASVDIDGIPSVPRCEMLDVALGKSVLAKGLAVEFVEDHLLSDPGPM